VDQLRLIFEDCVVEKFDKDSITTAKKLETTLGKFNERKIDILVGTQMLSKGHDYLGVKLAVILGLDHIVAIGDHQAMQRAISLMQQVSGRCARSGEGKVVIQTTNRNFFEKYIGDFEKFLIDEKENREGLYPPFVKFMRMLFVEKDQKKAELNMKKALSMIESFDEVEIVGAGRAAVEIIAGKFRYYILLRANKATSLIKAYHLCSSIKFDVDMDPINFS
jgi:primosomal protein N' (replication factor Y)